MRHIHIIPFLLAAGLCNLCFVACQEKPIPTFAPEDSAVAFHAQSYSFSFKGMTEDYRDVSLSVDLIGYCADYDREFKVETSEGTAQEGRDFTVVSSVLKAGEVKGEIVLRINHLPSDVERQDVKLRIVANDVFRDGPPAKTVALVSWSEEYVRPTEPVWRGWYTFFCHGYSKEYHKLLVNYFGEEVETFVSQQGPAKENPDLKFQMPTWWYTSSREFRNFIRKHDEAGTEPPYMHSEDYESYRSYIIPYGEGEKPEKIPTILETLNVL